MSVKLGTCERKDFVGVKEAKKLCIIVPIYKKEPSKEDSYSLERLKILAKGEDIFIIAPQKLNMCAYESMGWKIKRFSDKYFKSVSGYTRLCLTKKFYECFTEYQYMLIYQLDALLLKPSASIYEFIEMAYDYYGAPWPKGSVSYQYSFRGLSLIKGLFIEKICYVGNGGFSLRHIQHTIALLEEKKKYTRIWNGGEDKFFAYHGQDNKCGFRIAPIDVAEHFALEQNAKERILDGNIPVGVHAWMKYYPNLEMEKWM